MTRSTTTPVWRSTGAGVACAALVAVAAVAVPPAVAAGTRDVAGAAHAHHGGGHYGGGHPVFGRTLTFQSPLSDLQPTTTQPLEGARATLRMTLGASRSSFLLTVAGMDRAAAGGTFGAHLHTGPCVPGDGAAAGPHYNSVSPPVVDADHEVWLDFTVSRSGSAWARTVVPFVPAHGARALVVHEMATDHGTGLAGARLACIPVVW
jgi:Cu-Zn family superoxide dismutase